MLIYALTDRNGAWRYIGKTEKTLVQRLAEHMKLARRGVRRYVYNWIRSLGSEPGALEVERCASPEALALSEVEWIAEARRLGVRLTNATDGGEGAMGYRHDDATREKMRGRTWSVEAKERAKGREFGSETRARMSESAKKRGVPVGFAAMRAVSDPSAGGKALWIGMSSEERRRKMDDVRSGWDGRHTPETKQRLVANLQSESVNAKRAASVRTPEVRAKIGAASKAQWARRKAAKAVP